MGPEIDSESKSSRGTTGEQIPSRHRSWLVCMIVKLMLFHLLYDDDGWCRRMKGSSHHAWVVILKDVAGSKKQEAGIMHNAYRKGGTPTVRSY